MAIHERVWERTAPAPVWKPRATYGLLIAMVVVYILELMTINASTDLFETLWIINTDWYLRPWSLVTSTLSHGGLGHLFGNGLMLFFFGPVLERLLGPKAFVPLFFLAGAISGVLQVHLTAGVYGSSAGALGASGAIMWIFGALVYVMPNQKLYLIFPPIPLPFWVAGVGYALLDLLGAFNPADGIGNFAHLAGMALGLATGAWIKKQRRAAQPTVYYG